MIINYRIKNKSIKNRKNSGITLIALVITIIVLLILAGVVIASLTGENGILNRAASTKDSTDRGELIDKVKLEILNNEIGKKIGEADNLRTILERYFTVPSGADLTDMNLELTSKDGRFKVKIGELLGSAVAGGGDTLPSTTETSPWLPTSATVTENDLSKGVTVKDGNDNEWVWIVVPKSVTASVALIGENENPTGSSLENALKAYAETVVTNRGSYADTWYSQAQTGLTSDQYTAKKRAMLNSIKTNGGFWIGKYEVGSNDVRASGNTGNTSTPLIQKNKYPYTYVTCSEAEGLAETLTTGLGGTGSLMFGTQWDLVMAYIRNNTNPQLDVYNSTTWGNHYDSALTITNDNAKGSTNPNNTTPTWNIVTGKAQNSSVLLTTGASDETNVLNICDIAGNVWEWTLEYSSNSNCPCTGRGGAYNFNGTSIRYPVTGRYLNGTSGSLCSIGLRPSLY